MRKKKTTYCTVSLTTIMLRSRTSCFVINDFLGYCLKRYFTCKLGCMLLAKTVVLKSVQCFSLCSRHSDSRARTSVHCFFQFRLVYNTWFELSRVKLQRSDLKGNKNYFELARVNYSNWLYEGIPGEIDLSERDIPVSESLNNRDDQKV